MIVVAGEALVDLVPDSASAPEGHLAALLPRAGGGPYNTAIAAARLGTPTALLSRVSRDAFGEHLLRRLAADGGHLHLVQRGDEPTTLAAAVLDEHGSAGFSFYADGTADRLFTDPGPLPDTVRVVSFGTLSLVLEPGASAYEAVLRREAHRGAATTLDPNIRPSLIPDPDAYRDRFDSWLPHTSLLKLSVEDAEWLADGKDVDAAVRRWLGRGPAAVVLTRGADGLEVRTRRGAEASVPVAPGPVADTIGAGDTVHGALLHGLARHAAEGPIEVDALDGAAWTEVLRLAARAAGVTVSRAGAEPPYASEL